MWSEPTEILDYKCDGATYGLDFGLKITLQQAAVRLKRIPRKEF